MLQFIRIASFLLFSLFGLTLNVQAQLPEPTEEKALFKVSVLKMDGSPRANNQLEFRSEDGTTFKGTTDEEGFFAVLLPKNKTFNVFSQIFNEVQQIQQVAVPGMEGKLTFSMKLEYDMSGWDVRMDGIQFDTGKYTLRKASYETLDEAIEFLKKNPSMKVEIQGHTDNVGTEEDNQVLSDNRARVVREYLVKNGIAPDRLVSNGYGESQPVADNATTEGRQENRRTVFKIVSE